MQRFKFLAGALALCTTTTALAAVPTADAGGGAPAPRVQVMVVGRHGTLVPARTVKTRARTVRIAGRRCTVPSGTALAALLATRIRVQVKEFAGGCDPTGMYVNSVHGQAGRGLAGWEYKVGRRSPSFGAADPGGRLRAGQQVLWFWCVNGNRCQRTLATAIAFNATGMRVHVIGYDNNGHGRAIAGATVHAGNLSAVTDSSGWASFQLTPGHYRVYATKRGLVPSFPTEVLVVT